MPQGSGLGGIHTAPTPTTTVSVPVDSTQTNQVASSSALSDRPVREVNDEPQTISFRERFNNACEAFKEKASELWQGFKDGCTTGWNNFSQGVKNAANATWDGIKHITPGLESQSQRNARINAETAELVRNVDTMLAGLKTNDLTQGLGESASLLVQFSQSEYTTENLTIFSQASSHLYPNGRESDSQADRHQAMTGDANTLRTFVDRFISDQTNSREEVNLAHNTRRTCMQQMTNYENSLNALNQNTDPTQTNQLKANVDLAHTALSDSIEGCLKEISRLSTQIQMRFSSLDH